MRSVAVWQSPTTPTFPSTKVSHYCHCLREVKAGRHRDKMLCIDKMVTHMHSFVKV